MDTREAREFFKDDIFAKNNGITIKSVGVDESVCAVIINETHYNAGGAVQGGLIFTLADFAYAVHANSLHPMTVTQSASISYIKACRSTILTAVAKELSRSAHNCVGEVVISGEDGTVISIALINGFIR